MPTRKKRIKPEKNVSLLKKIGPGFITGASDDDPSGIATYSQTGAMFGFNQLWTAFFSFPFMTVIQEMCGRIGLVTGNGLAGIIKKHYSKKILYSAIILLFIANTINVGADLGAMAAAAQLIFGLPFWILLVTITLVTLILEILVPYPTYAKFLKYLTFSLFAYIITVFLIKINWNEVAYSTFVPYVSFSKEYMMNIVAILGTTISPYLFFWQADEEVEEEINQHKIRAFGVGKPKISKFDIKSMRIDTVVGMLFSNVVMFFIIVATASTLGANGITHIDSAAQAASALKPFAGDFAFLLFALGIIGTGMLAVPVLAGSAAYAISEAFNFKAGLSKTFKQAHIFYILIAISTLSGLLVNYSEIKPFDMLYYTAILNGICAPPLMILILLIANNKKIMGKHTNSLISNILGITITVIMSICAIAVFF